MIMNTLSLCVSLVRTGILLGGLLFLVVVRPADAQQWQWPESLENAKVLPETTTADELSSLMRGFTRSLGVRCEFCHAGEAGQPLSTFDFASDEKSTKETARLMMRMVRAVNENYVAEVEQEGDSKRVTVQCVTCHRGQSRPRMLAEVLDETIQTEGVQAAVAQYRTLRERFYGGFSYDFTEGTLLNFGDQLVSQGRIQDGLEMLKLNAEMYPESVFTYYSMGEAHVAASELEQALAAYEKALSVLPEDPRMRGRFQQRIEQRIKAVREQQ